MSILDNLKKAFTTKETDAELHEDYVELEADIKDKSSKVLVRPFTLTQYDDIKDILNAIRDGTTISVIDIAPLKDKDLSELKRAVDKIKKTVEANDGDIAAFGENFLLVTPAFAKVWRRSEVQKAEEPQKSSENKIDEEF
ncbi:MAG: cell division protein SepF [Candidatus Nanoarchaeia archaeon]